MDTIFLAIVIGWYLVIMGLLLLVRSGEVKSAMLDIFVQRGLYFMMAVITLILGLLMVVSHNIWVMGWPVAVTLFSWLVLISGLFRLFFSNVVYTTGQKCLRHPMAMKSVSLVCLLLGVFFLLYGYRFHA